MREISLAVLDIAQNAIDAGAKHVCISVAVDEREVKFAIEDDGEGSDKDLSEIASVGGISTKGSGGLGLYLLRQETQSTGGNIEIFSLKGVGTTVKARYIASSETIGDLGATFVALVDDGYDVTLNIDMFGKLAGYDSRELKFSANTAELQSSGKLRLARENINKFIRQNGGAML